MKINLFKSKEDEFSEKIENDLDLCFYSATIMETDEFFDWMQEVTKYGKDLAIEQMLDTSDSVSESIVPSNQKQPLVNRIVRTGDYDKGLQVLLKSGKTAMIEKLVRALDDLCYERVGSLMDNHPLKKDKKRDKKPKGIKDLHLTDNLVLIYRYYTEETLVLSLEVINLDKHKNALDSKGKKSKSKKTPPSKPSLSSAVLTSLFLTMSKSN